MSGIENIFESKLFASLIQLMFLSASSLANFRNLSHLDS